MHIEFYETAEIQRGQAAAKTQRQINRRDAKRAEISTRSIFSALFASLR
jgi:hypothetical protein